MKLKTSDVPLTCPNTINFVMTSELTTVLSMATLTLPLVGSVPQARFETLRRNLRQRWGWYGCQSCTILGFTRREPGTSRPRADTHHVPSCIARDNQARQPLKSTLSDNSEPLGPKSQELPYKNTIRKFLNSRVRFKVLSAFTI